MVRGTGGGGEALGKEKRGQGGHPGVSDSVEGSIGMRLFCTLRLSLLRIPLHHMVPCAGEGANPPHGSKCLPSSSKLNV